MGEQPQNVYCVGALGIENIKKQKLLKKEELEKSIGFSLKDPFVLVTYHPVTMEANTAKGQFENLLKALAKLPYRIIFTKANADAEGKAINKLIDEYTIEHSDRTIAFSSLGMIRYLSALRLCRMVIGNSSSGIIEAPSFKVPTINIGIRQKGRERACSVIDCGNSTESILGAVEKAEAMYMEGRLNSISNPYEGEKTSEKIYEHIIDYLEKNENTVKHFYDLPLEEL